MTGVAVRTSPAHAAAGDITTVAGTGTFNFNFTGGDGDGGPALNANIPPPFGVATAPGKYYFSETFGLGGSFANPDINRVRMVQNGTISSVAGGVYPPSPDGVPATQTFLLGGGEVVADAAGNLYIATGDAVRKVDATTGIITTVINFTSRGIIAIDGAGNLYLVSFGNGNNGELVTKLNPTTATTTTVAGGGSPADGLGDGLPATSAQVEAEGLAVDAAGDIYIASESASRIRRVDAATGIITTVAGDGTNNFAGDGGPATSAELACPNDVAIDSPGNLYIADSCNNRIRKVDTTGTISTFAGGGAATSQCPYSGDGGPATSATMCFPFSVVADGAGNVYIGDTGNSLIRKVDSSGTITRVAGQPRVFGFLGDGGPATAAEIQTAIVALDPAGDILIDDASNNRIREIDHNNGIITTVAGGGVGDGLPALQAMLTAPEGLAVDPAGNLLIADCGDGRVRKVDSSGTITSIAGVSGPRGLGDGGAATLAALQCPAGLAFDSAGNLYIADSADQRVRRVDPSGVITTVAGTGTAGFSGDGGKATAAQLNQPSGVVVDAAGNLFIADLSNNRVRKVDTKGTITTVAGNGNQGGSVDGVPATSVPVVWPLGLAIGASGNLVVAESGFARVRSVDAKGIISTIAGNGIPGYSGDGGPGPLATLDEPTGVAFDSAGNLLIADNQNVVIRSVAPGTPPPPPPVTKKTANCGITVTRNLTLADDIGPCPGDGVIIGANGVHLDLNGHTISGTYSHTGQHVGIRATGRQKLKISNGTVTGFDAGVALISGSNNVVTGMTVANNQGGQNTFNDTFGDGIVMFFSAGNTVVGNTVASNGPFDGIAMLGQGADKNLVQNNVVRDTTNFNKGFFPGLGLGIVTNPFLGFDRPRSVSLNANQIVGNTVINNGSGGISTISNVGGVVRSNLVERNGSQGFAFPGNGIGVTHASKATPNTNELVEFNQVIGNFRDGIQVFGPEGNKILNNTGTGNGRIDFLDFDRDPVTFQFTCGTNTWNGNVWGSAGLFPFFPKCTSAGGHALPGGTTLPLPMVGPIPQGLGDPPVRPAP